MYLVHLLTIRQNLVKLRFKFLNILTYYRWELVRETRQESAFTKQFIHGELVYISKETKKDPRQNCLRS